MADPFIDPGGIVVPASALTLRRSREVVLALEARDDLFAKLVECRKSQGVETVVLDVEVERPQVLANDIQRTERVAIIFSEGDGTYPEVNSLRPDFPATLHLQQGMADYPRSLCLYDRPWPEVRVNWTGPSFIERIRWWFAGTAKGNLHADDQPLEPLLLSAGIWLIVPAKLPAPMTPCVVHFIGGPEGTVLVAEEMRPRPGGATAPAANLLLRFESPPRTHGTSPRAPTTLADVCDLLSMPGFDLLELLRDALKKWSKEDLGAKIVLLIDLPKTAKPGGPVVAVDRKAFCLAADVLTLGSAIGVWSLDGKKRGLLLATDQSARGQTIKISVANVTQMLSPDDAAMYNGAERSDPTKVFAVGAGALGSQVILNLARAGFGRWTIVDSDQVLPHNLARHALDGAAIGFHKADAVAGTVNSLFSEPIAKSIEADVLSPGKRADIVTAALKEAELVLDLSASISVARHLAQSEGGARRMSVFLSPSGHDLIMLCEDREREMSLDLVEMAYYAAVASDPRLQGHLDPPAGRKRYGLSCRDLSSRIAQADVGMFAGIAARAVPQACGRDGPTIRVWRSNPDSGEVFVIDIEPETWSTRQYGDWTLQIAEGLLQQIAEWRLNRLPNETGGILMGGVDHERRTIYLSLALPSPADSDEYPTMYIRGSEGTRKEAEEILDRTAGNVIYLGEWHSHPKNHPTLPSADDLIVLASVAEWVNPAGQPGLILIAGDNGRASVLVEAFDPAKPPEELCPA